MDEKLKSMLDNLTDEQKAVVLTKSRRQAPYFSYGDIRRNIV